METDCLLRRLQIYFYEFLINSHGITGLLLKAKKIAASPSTTLSQKASKLMYRQESGLFDFRRTKIPPLLLVIDRSDDLVTPLLNKWTYQVESSRGNLKTIRCITKFLTGLFCVRMFHHLYNQIHATPIMEGSNDEEEGDDSEEPQHIDEVTLKILSISRVYSSRFSQQ
ncbi:uncharacterized protein LOC111892649 [Lactuca sativa]|uniref:uncharacterized protein LOC111892649 n=1 Tax=Lactuca sativa TaxID=4236 RepID=UPI001C68A0D8|nr:uncharacterized protein LOC111892649 [Lactuca sativa]